MNALAAALTGEGYAASTRDVGSHLYRNRAGIRPGSRLVEEAVPVSPSAKGGMSAKGGAKMAAMELAEAPPETIRIRHGFAPGDIAAIAKMHGDNYGSMPGFDAVALEAYVAGSMSDLFHSPEGGRLWIAERADGTVVGSIGITRDSDEIARLRWYIMLASVRGLGVGRRLIEQAMEFVRERGYEHVWLSTVSGLEASAHLYRSVGFELVDEWDANTWGEPVREQRYELAV